MTEAGTDAGRCIAQDSGPRMAAFHLLAKPAGPACNLRCTYCFYLEKSQLFEQGHSLRMSDAMLEAFVRDRIRSQDAPEIEFAWQGGEPTLLGVDFFRRAVALQRRYADGRRITNALQTNGTLIDDAWAEFLAANGFLVGISIDGPADLHDAYRVDALGAASLDRVLRGLRRLQAHGVEFNTLTVVNRLNAQHPLKVYRFLKEIGSHFQQFIPLVERKARSADGAALAGPPSDATMARAEPTAWSVTPVGYGTFLVEVFDEWVRHDVGSTYVQLFDSTLGSWLGLGSSLCVFAPTCGRAIALEHDGTAYACDHYVYPQYRLGRLGEQTLAQMVDSPQQRKFGADKQATLPEYCRRCDLLFACNGGCPKHRFLQAPDGEPGLNYLCAAYKRFFGHVDPYMRTMEQLLRDDREPAEIMALLRESRGRPPRARRSRRG
jgi:uncharacterized protein